MLPLKAFLVVLWQELGLAAALPFLPHLLGPDLASSFSPPDRPSQRPRGILACSARVNEEGWYELGGRLSVRGQFPPYCSLKLRAPLRHKVQVSFSTPPGFNCDQDNLLMALNGWQVADKLRRRSRFVPAARAKEERRRLVCAPQTLTTDDNIAELVYNLDSDVSEGLAVRVRFVAAEVEGCHSVVERSEAGQRLRISLGEKDESCRWLLPGAISLRLLNVSSPVGGQGPRLGLLAGQSLETLGRWGSAESLAHLPCQWSAVELSGPKGAWAEFRFRPIPFRQKLLGEMDCE